MCALYATTQTNLVPQASGAGGLAKILAGLQNLYKHAAEPKSESAYAQALPLCPVLAAACQRSVQLLGLSQDQVSGMSAH